MAAAPASWHHRARGHREERAIVEPGTRRTHRRHRRRRLRVREYLVPALLVSTVVGVVGGAVLATLVPQPEPPAPIEPLPPAPGRLLSDGENDAMVMAGSVRHVGAEVHADVEYIRGRTGRATVVVRGCPQGGVVLDTGTGDSQPWRTGAAHLQAQIAQAACSVPDDESHRP